MVRGGGPFVGPVTPVVRDRAEGLALGQIDQPFGQAAVFLRTGPEAIDEFLDAGRAVGGVGERGSGGAVGQGAHPRKELGKLCAFRTATRDYHD